MHLLNVKTRKLELFFDRHVPKYAVLSHTWGDHEETFGDFQEKMSRWRQRYRLGSNKIRGCCAQAASDGLGYIWIDTCCIDKSSSAELSEAINSMFAWYSRATVCYVYLADVRSGASKRVTGEALRPSSPPLSVDAAQLEDLGRSRWFTRGWTLQELLAPSTLKFYDCGWNLIGYSGWLHAEDGTADHQAQGAPCLTPLLAEITGIPKKYLQNADLNRASVAERMSWAAGRQTTRPEDMAYCLLGVFKVNMPMLYGEGEAAFVRLQEEIMRKEDDHSIFAWGRDIFLEGRGDGDSPMALCPADFRHCSLVTAHRPDDEPSNHYVTTNAGIQIKLPLVRLQSGEHLARLNCTVDSDQSDVLLEDKYLCLILIPSHDRKKVFYRRTSASPILVPLQYFKDAVHQSIYMAPAPSITYNLTRTGPLFVSATCAKVFRVKYTYPATIDIQEGLYFAVSDLWKGLKEGNSIFLDCKSVTAERFALQIQFEWESGEDTQITSANMLISRLREDCSIAQLMMGVEGSDPLGVIWEKDVVVEGQRIVLEPAEQNQWRIDILPRSGQND